MHPEHHEFNKDKIKKLIEMCKHHSENGKHKEVCDRLDEIWDKIKDHLPK